jgi:hypothetical protein
MSIQNLFFINPDFPLKEKLRFSLKFPASYLSSIPSLKNNLGELYDAITI